MNILGVGPGELAVVFIIMLVVAGPKRMVQWAYLAGRYIAQLRATFQETLNAVQKELAESGLDIPKDLPNLSRGRIDILSEAAKIINPPIQAANAPETPVTADDSEPAKPLSDKPVDANDSNENPKYDLWLPN